MRHSISFLILKYLDLCNLVPDGSNQRSTKPAWKSVYSTLDGLVAAPCVNVLDSVCRIQFASIRSSNNSASPTRYES